MTTALQQGAVVSQGRLASVRRGSLGGRAVAIKQARADVPGAAAALRREARVLGAVAHPAIVPLLDLLDHPLAPTLVLGWADGGSLADLLADGPLSSVEVVHVLRPVGQALDAMHLAGVAHLDVSIHNVLLAAAGPVLIDPAPPGAGTPGFSDPVVAAGGPASSRSDVFGLAACAHVALTGRFPCRPGGEATGAALPAAVAEVLAAGLHPQPGRRPAAASMFVDRLAAALAGTGSPADDPGRHHFPTRPGPDVRPVARAGCTLAACVRTWPFSRWQEEADAARRRDVALAALIQASPPASGRRRRALVALALAVACGLGCGAAARSFAVRNEQNGPVPRRLTALDVPLQPVRRPPQPLEANHDTTTPDHALACCPWPRTRAGG